MHKCFLPDSELDFMHEVHQKDGEQIKSKVRKSVREGTLYGSYWACWCQRNEWEKWSPQLVLAIPVWAGAPPLHCGRGVGLDKSFHEHGKLELGGPNYLLEQGLVAVVCHSWFLIDARRFLEWDTLDMGKDPCCEWYWRELWVVLLDKYSAKWKKRHTFLGNLQSRQIS